MSTIKKIDQQPVSLHAGPLHLFFDNGMLRSICMGNIEIVRRIYIALRDRHWNTLPYTIDTLCIQQEDRSFSITFKVHYSDYGIVFNCLGSFTGTADGTINAFMQGIALNTFYKNRIGWCILHPLTLCRNMPCEIETPGGITEQKIFPGTIIAPYQPFSNIQAITFPVDRQSHCRISFTGDIFETEDQRNWTDGSFKTYSTPLSLPLPMEIKAGEHIEQQVTVTVSGSTTTWPHRSSQCRRPTAHTFTIDIKKMLAAVKPSPIIGIGCTLSEMPFSDTTIKNISRLNLHHTRFEIDAAHDISEDTFVKIAAFCSASRSSAEPALFLSDDYRNEAKRFSDSIVRHAIPIKQLIIYNESGGILPAETFDIIAKILGEKVPSVPLYHGTNRYFADINRSNDIRESGLGICFSANPQVHTSDECSIIENLEGLTDAIRSIKYRTKNRQVALSPLTLKPRKNRYAPEKWGGSDPRQQKPFCAAWLTGVISSCVMSGLDSLTCFDSVTGKSGIMNEFGNQLFPVYYILESGITQATTCSSVIEGTHSPEYAALLFSNGSKLRLLIANLSDHKITVTIGGKTGILYAPFIKEAFVSVETSTRRSPVRIIPNEKCHLPGYAVIKIDL